MATTPDTLDFGLFDCDNHYYEATDAFTRHVPPELRKRTMQWAEVDGRTRLLVGGKVNRFIPNPTFDPVSKPGALDEYMRGRNPRKESIGEIFGDLEPIRPEYRDRDARLAVMDRQGIEGAFLFPTLGVGMEAALRHDPEANHAAFSAFNRWLEDDWGYAYRDRIFAAPVISLLDPARAVEETERVLEQGAHLLCMRSAPAEHPGGNRSPADPVYDPVWRLVDEAGVTVGFHSGDSSQSKLLAWWGEPESFSAFRFSPMQMLTSYNPIHDTMAVLISHGLFWRFPNLRVATIESGSGWVRPLVKQLTKAYGQMPFAFEEDPVETFRRHVWVAPFYEDDIRSVADTIGADHVLMGSDWPHAEGLVEPRTFVDDLQGFSADEIRLVMRENGLALSRPRPPG